MGKFAYIKGNRLAKAAVENALWELMVQRTGKSLKTLLGGTQKEIKVGVSLGIERILMSFSKNRTLSGAGISSHKD